MRRVVADAYYWVALLNHRDQGHAAARAIGEALRGATLVTTEEVLAEVLGFSAGHGRHLRHAASALVEGILGDPACHGPMAYAYNPVPSSLPGWSRLACGHTREKSGRRLLPPRSGPPRYHDRSPPVPLATFGLGEYFIKCYSINNT